MPYSGFELQAKYLRKMPKNKISCSLGAQDFLAKVATENHSIYVDEPTAIGGGDLYPNPTEYLLTALASCTVITMKMYAKNKGWATGEITIDVQLKDVLTNEGTHKKIIKVVKFEAALPAAQIKRLLVIGSRCPISKLLAQPIEMEISE